MILRKYVVLILTFGFILSSVSPYTFAADDNLIDNGDFESGYTTSWSWSNAQITTAEAYDGSSSLSLKAGDWPLQYFTATQNTDYVLTLYLKGNASLVAFVANNVDTANRTRLACNGKSSSWTKFSAEFNSRSNTKIDFSFTCVSGTAYIDGISIVPKNGGNPPEPTPTPEPTPRPNFIYTEEEYGDELVINGSFENVEEGWDYVTAVDRTSAYDGECSFVMTPSKYPAQDIELEPNTNYRLRVYAKGEGMVAAFVDPTAGGSANRLARMPLVNSAGISIDSKTPIALDSAWVATSQIFNTKQFNTGNVHFVCTEGTLNIDNVSVQKVIPAQKLSVDEYIDYCKTKLNNALELSPTSRAFYEISDQLEKILKNLTDRDIDVEQFDGYSEYKAALLQTPTVTDFKVEKSIVYDIIEVDFSGDMDSESFTDAITLLKDGASVTEYDYTVTGSTLKIVVYDNRTGNGKYEVKISDTVKNADNVSLRATYKNSYQKDRLAKLTNAKSYNNGTTVDVTAKVESTLDKCLVFVYSYLENQDSITVKDIKCFTVANSEEIHATLEPGKVKYYVFDGIESLKLLCFGDIND